MKKADLIGFAVALALVAAGVLATDPTSDECGDACVAERLGCYDLPPDHPDYNDVDACIFGRPEK